PVAVAASAGGRVRKVPVAVAAALAPVAAAAASIPAGFATARARATGRLTAANARRLIAGGSLVIVVAAVAAIVATLGGGGSGAKSGAHRASARPHASPPRTIAQVPRSTPVPAAPAPAAAPPTPTSAPAARPAPASTPSATSTTPATAPSPAQAPTPAPTPPAAAKALGPLAQLGAAGAAPGHASPAAASELDLEGHQLLGEGRYPAAVDRLLGALHASGESLTRCTQPTTGSCLTFAYALYDLGRALRLSGDAGAAIPILSRRLRINNQRSVVQHELDLARGAGA
ncbi:MAG: hypothetical protein JWL67_2499, partial [Solirubrobacterales bacterium]|nr:hypothetical protein [Solirubrobacterales bacterium]